ncbi:MAG TPA: GNAT family N-acetyltransferase [Puia sp.]|nr:GNAT family N-acetyltransferase [Puia sp.]
MKEQLLDNPTYHAMITGNANLSLGSPAARYFPAEISPFVGLADFSPARFDELAQVLPAGRGTVAVVSPEEIVIPAGWKVNFHGLGLQMVGEHAQGPALADWEFVELGREHVPLMVDLAKLTNPGPFGQRTIEFGNFVGVFDGERLMAMSGHRLHPSPYIEVSGVCTHPDYAGRGLGAALTYFQVERIRKMGEIPMLHVWAHNVRAIRLYERLGFVIRRKLHFTMIERSV